MIRQPLRLAVSTEPYLQIGAGAERLPSAGQHHHLDAIIQVEHGKDLLKVFHHLHGEGIVLVGTVESDHHDGGSIWGSLGMVRDLDMGGLEGFVGRGDFDGRWIGDHLAGRLQPVVNNILSQRVLIPSPSYM